MNTITHSQRYLESLLDKSHKPLSPHPNSHTAEELKWIRDYHRRNPHISVCELYGKLRTAKSYSTIDFLKRAIDYFGYQPEILQTDNGSEFTNIIKTGRKHILAIACEKLCIRHQKIHPRTPRHNGKVERSHRNDQVFRDILN